MRTSIFTAIFTSVFSVTAFANTVSLFKYDGPEFALNAKISTDGNRKIDVETFTFSYDNPSPAALQLTTYQQILGYLGSQKFQLTKDDLILDSDMGSRLLRNKGDHYVLRIQPGTLPIESKITEIWLFPETGEIVFQVGPGSNYFVQNHRGHFMNRQAFDEKNIKVNVTTFKSNETIDLQNVKNKEYHFHSVIDSGTISHYVFDGVVQVENDGEVKVERLNVTDVGWDSNTLLSYHANDPYRSGLMASMAGPTAFNVIAPLRNEGQLILWNSETGASVEIGGMKSKNMQVQIFPRK